MWNILIVLVVAWIVGRHFTADFRARVSEFDKVVSYAKTSLTNRQGSANRRGTRRGVEGTDGEDY